MTDFLPGDYKQPPSIQNYLRLSEGDNRFRILGPAVIGWEDWNKTGNKNVPIRSKVEPTKEQLVDPTQPAKHFWAFVVWSYKEKQLQIAQFTQRGIQDEILTLDKDVQWGSPMGYDLNIKREGTDFNTTKYFVNPAPPSPVDPAITAAYVAAGIDLEELFVNGDPFAPAKGAGLQQATGQDAPPTTDAPPLADGPPGPPPPPPDEPLKDQVPF